MYGEFNIAFCAKVDWTCDWNYMWHKWEEALQEGGYIGGIAIFWHSLDKKNQERLWRALGL